MLKKILIILTFFILFTGCSDDTDNNKQDITTDIKIGDVVLTTKDGIISMYDSSGEVINELNLGGGSESDYIYTLDEGNIYTSQIKNDMIIPDILYAVNKNTRKLNIVFIYKDELKLVKDDILQEGNIDKIYGYNGLFFYSSEVENEKANQHTYIRPQLLNSEGNLTYSKSIPTINSKDSIYVYMNNYFDEYINLRGLSNYVSDIDKYIMNMPKKEKDIFKLPGDTNNWVANNQNVYFFSDSTMGKYNISTNQITLYYGPIRTINSQYIDGINKKLFTINDFGDKSSKSILMRINYDNMEVEKTIEIEQSNPLNLFVNKNQNILAIFKNEKSNNNVGQLRVFDYDDNSIKYTIGIPYIPTKVLSKKDNVYLFNEFEDYYLAGSIHSSEFTKVNKIHDEKIYSDIFIINKEFENDYYYNENGQIVNKNNLLINSDGELINEYNDRINRFGQRIDESGRAINKDGKYIDRYNNVIDDKGRILEYTQNEDGYYYNSKGEYVSENGIKLVRNEIGDWVLPEEVILESGGIEIKGYYDEKGNFIINREILEEYPDAYEIWQEQQNQ